MPLNVKEYYMGIQQFLYGKDSGIGKCSYSNTELATKLGISIISVKKYNTYLVKNNYLEENISNQTDEAGLPIVTKSFDLEALNQAALWVKAVNEQLTHNTRQINTNTEDIAKLQEEVARLKKIIALKNNEIKSEKEYVFESGS